jgi:hypothetical protein
MGEASMEIIESRRLSVGMAAALTLLTAACAPMGAKNDPVAVAKEMATSTQVPPGINRTGFDPALRCMDTLFDRYGVRDVALLLEDIPDSTGKVKAGARDMFISATSRMTTRSHAIKLIPFKPSVAFMDRKDFIQESNYTLQGSVSQLDESVVKRQRDGAVCLNRLCIGAAESDSFNAIGLDLSIIRTSDLSLVPGVTSGNSVLITKHGNGEDGELHMDKFGVNFNFSMSRSEGQSQALRSLVELGSIEVYGKLLKIPYWTCLGNAADQADVSAEISDWWESLAGDTPALVRWLQQQMRTRGLYEGKVDGVATDALLRAVNTYKAALGLPADGQLNGEFFRAYMTADHQAIERQRLQSAPKLAAQPAPPGSTAAPQPPGGGELLVQDRRGRGVAYDRGQHYEVLVRPPRDGNLYCWLIDEDQHLNQFFPAPEKRSASVRGGADIVFPGPLDFVLFASRSGKRETVACAQTDRDLGFSPIADGSSSVRDLNALKGTIQRLSGGAFTLGAFDVQPK